MQFENWGGLLHHLHNCRGVNFAVVGAMINQYNINSIRVVKEAVRVGKWVEIIMFNLVRGFKYKIKSEKKRINQKKSPEGDKTN